jgi:hypothetical protein
MATFSARIREAPAAPVAVDHGPPGAGERFEVIVLKNDEPVMLCRHRLELREDWQLRDHDFNVWRTVDPPALWVERCNTLAEATRLANERAELLNRLAELFDADTAVSLLRRWDIPTG